MSDFYRNMENKEYVRKMQLIRQSGASGAHTKSKSRGRDKKKAIKFSMDSY